MKTNTLDFDAQALRERILDLAMRGKLVPQDPSDEPASVLLEKIKAEKEELVKEKKIKKTKPLPEITDDEKPFDIPDSWEWVRCQKVTTIGNFQTVSPNEITLGDNLIELADIESYSGRLINSEIVENKVGSNKYRYTKGQVLFAKLRPYLRKILVAPNDGVCTTELLPISGINVSNEYLYYIFMSDFFFNQIKKEMHGVNLPRVSPKKLSELIFPLPPLSEQKRIAAKIAQLFALLRKVESSTKQYAKLQTLLKSKVLDLAMRGKLVKQDPNDEPASVLLEKIKAEKAELVKEKKIKKSKPLSPITDEEKPFDIPDSWEWVRLGDISNFMNGFAYKSKLYVKKSNNQVIRLGNVKNDQLIVDKKQVFIDDDYADATNNYRIKKGDLLFTMTGTRNKRDYFFTLLVNEKDLNNHNLYLNQRVGCLNYIFGVNKLWLNYILKSQTILDEVFKNETGTVNQGNIGATKTMQIVIPLPPLSEQRRIATRIEQLDKLL